MKKKNNLMFLATVIAAVCLWGFSACGVVQSGNSGNLPENTWTVEKVYARAQELGYEGTLEELLDELRGESGKDGKDGADGVGVAEIVIENDNLIIRLTDGTVVDCGKVTGTDGKDGQDGVGIVVAEINENGNLILTLSDGNKLDLGKVTGENGKDGQDGTTGKGISNVLLNENGELIVYFTDNTSENIGAIKGADGKDGTPGADGVGIQNIALTDGNLSVTLTSGTVIDLGNIKGQNGADGTDGVGVTKTEINESGELVLTYTNGNSVNLGKVTGENGTDGKDGQDGVGIASVAFNSEGELVVTMTDGSVTNCGRPPVCNHTYSEWELGQAATCTSIGYYQHTCSKCGNVEYEFIEETGHTWNNGYIISKPTCEENGLKIYGCTICSSAKYEEIPAIDHSYVDGKCEICGQLKPSEGLEYSIYDTYAIVVGIGTCTDTYIVIPALHDGLPVTSIGTYAFENCNQMNSIFIPNSVTSIGFCAFKNCTLTNFTMHNSIKNFTSNTFLGSSIYNIYFEGNIKDWCSIVIDDGTDSSPMVIAENLYISGELISGDLVIPEGVIEINSYAFYNKNITSVTIPSSVTRIKYQAFFNNNISEVIYKGTLEQWCAVDFGTNGNDLFKHNPTFYINEAVLIDDTHRDLEIPNTVERIGNYAFCGYRLNNITIPTSVLSMGYYIFDVSDNNVNVYYQGTIEDWLKIELNGTFQSFITGNGYSLYIQNELLTELIVPANITTIKNGAFCSCKSITSIVMHDSVTSIGAVAFDGCSKLSSIVMSNSITDIGSGAFIGCRSLTDIALPIKLNKIGSQAFLFCDGLKGVYISNLEAWFKINFDNNVSIGDYTANPLYYAKNLYLNNELITELVIPDGITSIGNYMFYGCDSLTSIVISDSVIEIGDKTFGSCNGLESIIVTDGNTVYHSDGNCLIETASKTLMLGCKNSVIPTDGSVASIGSSAFSGCSSLTSIVIPEGVTSIGNYAFSGCSSLTSIVIPEGVTSIGNYAFSGCGSLTSVTIPDSVTSIGDVAFSGCSSLVSVTFGENSQLTSIEDCTFYGCNELKSIVIPGRVTSIGYQAFASSGLTSIEIPNSVTSIGWYAFQSCNSITSVVILGSVTSIGYGTFGGCIALISITIPDSVTSISRGAFYVCSSLTTVYYKGITEAWENIFIGTDNICLTNATIYCYSESEPPLNADGTAYDGNYWRYDTDGVTPVIWTKEN